MISKSNFKFLKDLSKNNNRDWFAENKSKYEDAHQDSIHFADELLDKMNVIDDISTVSGKKSLYRIYRDVRFSKDKSPYKNYWSGGMARATTSLRGGYFFHLEPGNTFIAGGFFGPNKEDLKLIRDQIANDPHTLRSILDSDKVQNTFGKLRGSALKMAPFGFDKEHEAIELLRHKSFYLQHNFTDKEVHNPEFVDNVVDTFAELRPYFDYMSEILTTDLNGISLV